MTRLNTAQFTYLSSVNWAVFNLVNDRLSDVEQPQYKKDCGANKCVKFSSCYTHLSDGLPGLPVNLKY